MTRRLNSPRSASGFACEPRAPLLVVPLALASRASPDLEDVVGNFEGAVIPAERFLRACEFFRAERFAVRLGRAGPGGGAEADNGLAGDQRRLVGLLRPADCSGDRLGIVAVDPFCVPAARLETRHLIDVVGQRDRAVDGDAVVVVKENQLVELEMTSQRDRLMADAFHQVAVGAQHIGVVVDHFTAELRGQQAFRQRKADRGGDALAERAGGGLDAVGDEVLGMARRLGVELPEILELIERHLLVAGQVQQRVEQHRAVAGGEDEAVAVRPVRIGGVVFQELGEQHRGDVGHAHRQAGMARFCFFNTIHRERADCIRHTGGIDGRHGRYPVQIGRRANGLHGNSMVSKGVETSLPGA